MLHTLTGVANNAKNGYEAQMNFILSNGQQSTQIDEDETYYDHMIPNDAHKRIRYVEIYYLIDCITGFSFLDKEGALIWGIGMNDSLMDVETVLIAKNEVIVGVVCKLYPGLRSRYTDFQF